jgi:hypothetical protein
MISFITQRPESDLVSTPAVLEGYNLAVQRLDQIIDTVDPRAPINKSARELMREDWDESFRSYVLQPNPEGRVLGAVFQLTAEERDLIRDWELIEFGWKEECYEVAKGADGEEIQVVTERLGQGQAVDHVVDGMNYETWLTNPARFEIVTEKDRLDHDRWRSGPEGSQPRSDIKNA